MTAAAVQGMKPGSVVVDLAGETGGNCELTEPGEVVVKHDVTIASPLNLPATMPEHASELYSKNITALLELLLNDGVLAPDFEDEVIAILRHAAGGTRKCTNSCWPTSRSWCCPGSSGSRLSPRCPTPCTPR